MQNNQELKPSLLNKRKQEMTEEERKKVLGELLSLGQGLQPKQTQKTKNKIFSLRPNKKNKAA